jgi:hypothetical protein
VKKILITIIFALLVTGLTACDENVEYIKKTITLDGNDVFYYETDIDICTTMYSTIIQLTDDIDYEILYRCNHHTVVLYEDEYIALTEYVENYLVSIDDLIESNLGFPIYYDSITNLLDIDINDFSLDEIIIRTLNGEFEEYGGEWTESTTVELNQQDIASQIVALMSTRIETNNLCDNSMCILLGNISPGSIYFSTDEAELRIDFYGNRYQIHYEKGDEMINIYSISFTEDNNELASYILGVYNESE